MTENTDTAMVMDQTLADIISQLFDPTDPDWTAQLLEYVAEHIDDETLPITLKAALDYNLTFKERIN